MTRDQLAADVAALRSASGHVAVIMKLTADAAIAGTGADAKAHAVAAEAYVALIHARELIMRAYAECGIRPT